MYKRLSAVMFPLFAVLLVGAGLWGYQEHQDKNSILIKAENQYQRAFHDLSYHVDNLQMELGKTLAVSDTSRAFQRKGLLNVWRLTSAAQNEIGQLPLTLLPFNETEAFLANVSNFAYQTAIRDLDKQPLTENEMKTLQTLYMHAQEISTKLLDVQQKVIASNLRWMDVELAIASENDKQDNVVIDGFKTMEKQVHAYSEVDWGPSVVGKLQKQNYKMLSGNELTKDDVQRKAMQFLGLRNANGMKVTENGVGSEYNTYSVTANQIQLDYTKKGGHLVFFMNPRKIDGKKLTLEQASDAAQAFLRNHDYPQMQAISYDEYDHAANLTFAKVQNKVIIYPQKLTIRVALDNGEITGLQANDFLFANLQDKQIVEPKLTSEQAKKAISTGMHISKEALALIENDMREEVLCYQFLGTMNGQFYKVFINADTGLEEKIELLRQADVKV